MDAETLCKQIKNFGLITKKLVDNAQKLLTLINIDNNVNYIKILKLLTNQDFDIDSFITITNTKIKIDNGFLSLAFSVLNGSICHKIIASGYKKQNISTFISEVLYNIDPILINNGSGNSNIYFSVCLAKQQYNYGINNLIYKPGQLNLYKFYKAILNDKTVYHPHNENEIRIYDAETALRLSELVDVKPFLYPLTDFDRNLMIQFELL